VGPGRSHCGHQRPGAATQRAEAQRRSGRGDPQVAGEGQAGVGDLAAERGDGEQVRVLQPGQRVGVVRPAVPAALEDDSPDLAGQLPAYLQQVGVSQTRGEGDAAPVALRSGVRTAQGFFLRVAPPRPRRAVPDSLRMRCTKPYERPVSSASARMLAPPSYFLRS